MQWTLRVECHGLRWAGGVRYAFQRQKADLTLLCTDPKSANNIALTLRNCPANTMYNGELAGKAVSVSDNGGCGCKECCGNGR